MFRLFVAGGLGVYAAQPGSIAEGASYGSGSNTAASTVATILASMSGVGSGAAPVTVAVSTNPRVQAIEKNLIAAAEMFDDATNVNASPEEKEMKAAVRAALISAPSTTGKFPGFGAVTGASFLRRSISAKLSLGELAAIGNASLRAAEAHVGFFPVNSKCSACRPNYAECPSGFDGSRSGTCVPSASYKGYCNKSVDLRAYSFPELSELTVLCDVCFLCA